MSQLLSLGQKLLITMGGQVRALSFPRAPFGLLPRCIQHHFSLCALLLTLGVGAVSDQKALEERLLVDIIGVIKTAIANGMLCPQPITTKNRFDENQIFALLIAFWVRYYSSDYRSNRLWCFLALPMVRIKTLEKGSDRMGKIFRVHRICHFARS